MGVTCEQEISENRRVGETESDGGQKDRVRDQILEDVPHLFVCFFL